MGSGPSTPSEPSTPAAPGDVPSDTARAEVDVDQVERLSHTQGFDADEYLVTRRDVEFPLTLHSRSKPKVEAATLNHASGEQVSMEVGEQTTRITGTTVWLRVPADASVGRYTLTISGKYESGQPFEVTLKRKVVVLFNAWSEKDGVYVEDEDWRQEYVLNSNGRVFPGNHRGMPWNLALYRPDCLRAVLMLLEEVSRLPFSERRLPVQVGREMSALVNVQDENGVIVGRWDGIYDNGRSPSFWRGSGEILQQFYQSGGRPVSYGQCWVFSGVLLSVLRILGFPSRSITNFSSAHDTNRNRTIDHYYSEDGEKLSYLSSGNDSIWNFHVWNEAWIARPDLPAGFSGWQVLDATPQEESPQGGGYRAGPAPLKAVKEGNSVPYDTNFVIAEVNADIKSFVVEDGVPRLFKVDTSTVGQTISTKAVGSHSREDVTDQYKHPEGSDWERRALYAGYKELLDEVHDVDFQIPEIVNKFGEDVVFKVNITNKARQHRIRGRITSEAVSYTGRVLREVSQVPVDLKVNKGKTETVTMTVEGSVFSEFPGTKVYVRFSVVLAVHGTSQMFSEEVNVAPSPPELEVIAPKQVGLGDEVLATVKFTNPLPVEMEDVTLNIESDELLHDDIIHTVGTVGPNAELSYPFKLVGLKLGRHNLVVGLGSDKVVLVTGEKEVEVVEEVVHRDVPDGAMAVEVKSVDRNLEENRRAHRTDSYDDRGLIVRRGQAFSLTVTARKSLPANAKVVSRATFQLITGTNRLRRHYTFEVDTVATVSGTTIKMELKPPADAAVGKYHVILTLAVGDKVTAVQDDIFVTILFNPWDNEDSCHYAGDPAHLEEYVLNNHGKIWVGSSYNNYGRPWQFAQFKKDSLDVALWAMDKMQQFDRGDPIKVTRHLSAMVNVQDDNGILVGNWSGDYSDAVSPLAWTGSAEILAQFNRTKRPVRYAQCWVFSGVETTLLRCLGLAARSISNFNSAHDTHFNRAIDKFFDVRGNEISTGDSIWNFHVWNEAWMARPDLPSGFGGWQALDSTPQEESPQGGGYRLGPCPRQAVKFGQRMNYDVEFVISEVNADVRYYTVNSDESLTLTRVNSTHVGKRMSTKAVGSNARDDVTLEYKFAEGSTSERAALLAETESEKQIGLELLVDDDVIIGQDFFVRAVVTNRTRSQRDFKLFLNGRATLYTGAPGQTVKFTEDEFTLNGGASKQVEMWVEPVDYLRILEGGNFMNFVAMVLVPSEEKLSLVKTTEFRLKTPDIQVGLPAGGLKLHQPATIQVEFKNPLKKRLTGGVFQLHGEGYVQDAVAEIAPVGPRGIVKAELQTIPVKRGSFDLVVRFTSDQLANIMGDEQAKVV